MKSSKLDPYQEIITDLLQKGFNNGQVREELQKKGCPVSLETVRKAISSLRAKRNFQVNRRGKGRPKKTSKRALCFLPELSDSSEKIEIPYFFYTLLNDNTLEQKQRMGSLSLMLFGMEGYGLERFKLWARSVGKEQVAQLGDLELCLLAFLGSGVGSVPVGKSEPEITSWLEGLIRSAVELRSSMRAEVGLPN